jgi:hypothetical protein
MLGTWRWNVVIGILGSLLTIAFSFTNNPITVVLLRSLYAFIAFFVLAYLFRFIWKLILQPPGLMAASELSDDEDGKGTRLDMKTPDESEDLNELLKAQLQDGAVTATDRPSQDQADFRPLNPPQLLSTKNTQPEELAKAIRHLTGE